MSESSLLSPVIKGDLGFSWEADGNFLSLELLHPLPRPSPQYLTVLVKISLSSRLLEWKSHLDVLTLSPCGLSL